MKDEPFFLGVEGGGTKTTAVLCSETGRQLRTLKLGCGNVAVLDRGSIAELLEDLVSGLSIAVPPAHATFAFAGIGRAKEKDVVKNLILRAGIANFTLMTDAELHYFSVFREGEGILIAAGTGSICLTRTAAGTYHQFGGLGYLLGDEGSGYDIGRRAIRSVLHAAERGESESLLWRELLHFYDLRHPREFVSLVYSSRNPFKLIASCAKLVGEIAEKGDATARDIIRTAAESLVELAATAGRSHPPGAPYRVGLVGGVLRENSPVERAFREAARQRGFQFEIVRPSLLPAAAAVIHSFQKTGKTMPATLLSRLQRVTF